MAFKAKTTKSSNLSRRQNFKLKQKQIKAQMGANSGKTARSVSRHAAIQGVANSMNNRNTTVTIKDGSKNKDKDNSQSQDSTNILGWLN